MSTRGIVAVGTTKKWKGVYNHFDSYESGLGETIKGFAREEGLEWLAQQVLDHPQGFSHFPEEAYPASDENMRATSEDHDKADWLSWEYVYVINPQQGKIWVGHHHYESVGPNAMGPDSFESGPPRTWKVLYDEGKPKGRVKPPRPSQNLRME